MARSYNLHLLSNVTVTEINNTPENLIPQTFTTLQDLINNTQDKYFVLKGDYIYDDTQDSALKKGIIISKDNFILDGNGYTIDANLSARIFNVTGKNVTIKNINFKNGQSPDYDGGALLLESNATIINCNFTNCHADNGGAIYALGSTIIENSNFKDNIGSTTSEICSYIDSKLT